LAQRVAPTSIALRLLIGGASIFTALLLAACGVGTTLTGSLSPQGSVQTSAAPADSQPSPAELREHRRILATYGGVYNDPRLQAVVDQVVEKLTAVSERPDLHYKVTILNSESVNAFALPTGHLYLTRGLIALANDESELAAVIGHEMGHVIARHAELRAELMRNAELSDRVFTDVVSDPRAGALALAKSKLELANFSQAQELQADAIGIRLAATAGFDPYGAVRFLASLERNAKLSRQEAGDAGPAPDFLASHPATPERIARALAIAGQYKPPAADKPQDVERAKDAYLADLDGMVYGEDPSEGFVRDRRFIHPKLGFTFTAPDGFILDNTAQAVLGVSRGGGTALRFDVVDVPAEQTLAAYLTSGWIENVDPSSVHDVAVNGFSGATATASGDNWKFRLYAIRFGSDVYRFIFATRHFTPAADQVFRQSVDTFRRLSLAEVAELRPLHVGIVKVGPGDTVEKLGKRMAVADRRIERFRVLNGLDPGARLKPGTEVKVAEQ
jgi:predicted Zn-dependent protease